MGVCVEYVEGGMLFTGFFLAWGAPAEVVGEVAERVAPLVRCQPATIERILRYELAMRAGVTSRA